MKTTHQNTVLRALGLGTLITGMCLVMRPQVEELNKLTSPTPPLGTPPTLKDQVKWANAAIAATSTRISASTDTLSELRNVKEELRREYWRTRYMDQAKNLPTPQRRHH